MHNCIFSIDSLKTGPFNEISYGPQPVHKCMETPQNKMISAAFQYKGWSKVIMVERLCFMARLQTTSNVDRMHDLSPEYILIIYKNLTDDWPGCWLASLVQDMHHPLPVWCCLFEAMGEFPQNIDPLVTVKKPRKIFEDYLMTSMPCKPAL